MQVAEGRCVMQVTEAHSSDVNCVSWNENDSHLLVTGGEEGAIKVWDLRMLNRIADSRKSAEGAATGMLSVRAGAEGSMGEEAELVPIALFTYHSKAITSLMWHPTDVSVLLAASRDESISIWDVSVEKDEAALPLEKKFGLSELPAQLLFVHLGQREVSEAKWHRLLPNLVLSTAAHGCEVWRPCTL